MIKFSNLEGFKTLMFRECWRFIRLANQTVVPPLITATLFILIFGYSLGSRIREVEGVSYMFFLIPGLIMMSVISSAYANTSSSLYISRFQGHIQELLVSSMSALEIVGAIVFGGVLRGLIVAILVAAVSMVLASIPIANLFIVAYFILCVAVIFSCAGFLTALWAQDFDRLSVFQTYILTPLSYLGGVFFSVEMLPPFWQKVALLNPILYFVNGLRYGFLGVSDVPIEIAAVAAFGVAVVMFVLCHQLFKRGYNIKS